MKKFFVFAIILSLILTFTGCIESLPTPFSETFDNTYPASESVEIEVHNFNGSITLTSWDKNEVRVYALKKSMFSKADLDKAKITVDNGKTFIIKSEKVGTNPQVSITYEIYFPKNLVITTVETSNGKIKMEGTSGDCFVRSSNGGITIISHAGSINASTSNGGIDVQNISGDAYLNTSNGAITVYSIGGKVKAETSNGELNIKNVKTILGARTSNGKIIVELPNTQESELELVTSNGSINCSIPRRLNLNIEATTSNGKIETSNIDIITQSFSNNYIRGKIGSGGNLLRISTSNANIYIVGID